MYVGGRKVAVRDVVCFDNCGESAIGQVYFHVLCDCGHLTCISVWEILATWAQMWTCTVQDEPILFYSNAIEQSLTYAVSRNDVANVLKPWGLYATPRVPRG